MDKYQRRQLRKRDEDRGKSQDSFDRYIKKQTLQAEQKQLKEAMRGYQPCPPKFLATAVAIYEGIFDTLLPFIHIDNELVGRTHFSRIHPYGTPWWDFVWDKDILGLPIKVNMKKTIQRHKDFADVQYICDEAPVISRTVSRTRRLQPELAVAVERMRTILRCHAIKEQLYMNVYHPRRIEKLLEQGGWEALENFAGL